MSELESIMARRRKLAEPKANEEDESSVSLSEAIQAAAPVKRTGSIIRDRIQAFNNSEGHNKSLTTADLASTLERRRQAIGDEDGNQQSANSAGLIAERRVQKAPSVVRAPLPDLQSVPLNQDFQAIMERRKRMAENQDTETPSKASTDGEEEEKQSKVTTTAANDSSTVEKSSPTEKSTQTDAPQADSEKDNPVSLELPSITEKESATKLRSNLGDAASVRLYASTGDIGFDTDHDNEGGELELHRDHVSLTDGDTYKVPTNGDNPKVRLPDYEDDEKLPAPRSTEMSPRRKSSSREKRKSGPRILALSLSNDGGASTDESDGGHLRDEILADQLLVGNNQSMSARRRNVAYSDSVSSDGFSWDRRRLQRSRKGSPLKEKGKRKSTSPKTSSSPSVSAFDLPDSADEGDFESFALFGESTFSSGFASGIDKTTSQQIAFDNDPFDFDTGDIFDQEVAFPAEEPSTVWDKSPLTEIPEPPPEKISISPEIVLTREFCGSPISNPMNGNILVVVKTPGGDVAIEELDPARQFVKVTSSPMLSPMVRRLVSSKYQTTVYRIDTVLSLASGFADSLIEPSISVAAMIDVLTLGSRSIIRIVVVWRWGDSPYVESILTPPAGNDFVYAPSTLQVADGLLFLAGSSPRGACVFVTKPAVRKSWSANYVGGESLVTCMTTTITKDRNFAFLAIALADLSVTLWWYKTALANEEATRCLIPYYRLEYESRVAGIESTAPCDDTSTEDTPGFGYCTHISWLPQYDGQSSLLLIALGFKNGLAVFHVDLPGRGEMQKEGPDLLTEPNESTDIASLRLIVPVTLKRWRGKYDNAFLSWMDLGPQLDPCIAVVLHDANQAHILMGTLVFRSYHGPSDNEDDATPFRLLSRTSVPRSATFFPMGALQCRDTGALLSPSVGRLVRFNLSQLRRNNCPVMTGSPGLSSRGDALLADSANDPGVLHVFTSLYCEKLETASARTWTEPRRRTWLCRTVAGDSELSPEEDAEISDSGEACGGAQSRVLCELANRSLERLRPIRLIRHPDLKICAIAFCPDQEDDYHLPSNAIAIALVDFRSEPPIFSVTSGRDLAFLPSDKAGRCRGIVLDVKGTSLAYFTLSESLDRTLDLSDGPCRPLVGVDSGSAYIDCQRIICFSGDEKVQVAVVGERWSDRRCCFVAGAMSEHAGLTSSSLPTLLPNIVTGRVAWFKPREQVITVVGLETDGTGYRYFAIGTSNRAIILSSALIVAAEATVHAGCTSLAPIGSFSACFQAEKSIDYICCLDEQFARGKVASLPSDFGSLRHSSLLFAGQDRVIFLGRQQGICFAGHGQDDDGFLLPMAITRPSLMLEPMVANAICFGRTQQISNTTLRTVVEKFGRKMASFTHGEGEGIGQLGAGITSRTFEMLSRYGSLSANSWLLTGATEFQRSANSRIIPPWVPIAPKSAAALNTDAFLHVAANGDEAYLLEYLKIPESSAPPALPKETSQTAAICSEHGVGLLQQGDVSGAVKILDLAGAESTDTLVFQMAMMLDKEKKPFAIDILKSLSGCGGDNLTLSNENLRPPATLAGLTLGLKSQRESRKGVPYQSLTKRAASLALSIQRRSTVGRSRQEVIAESVFKNVELNVDDKLWSSPCNESKHFWNQGPSNNKQNLLRLDELGDWLGRARPLILGTEGADAAQDRGEKTLADLLNQEDDAFGSVADDLATSTRGDGWVDGVGEGRSDDANLVCYLRMSEGEDETCKWRTDGLLDMSSYQNTAEIVGDSESFSLQPSTSSVDEGEPGKVKSLFDLVFGRSGSGMASGLVIPSPRGSSLDVGVLHGLDRDARENCSLEFWYFIPSDERMAEEIVLARRTMGASAGDMAKACLASSIECVLWELVLRTGTRELVFRTCAGSELLSSQLFEEVQAENTKDSTEDPVDGDDLVVFGRWNHVCLVLSSKGLDASDCSVSIHMKGATIASSQISVVPPGRIVDDLRNGAQLADLLKKSHLVFGLNHSEGFRMTEIRIWACQRSAEDVKSFLYEYLTAAEQKKKFKVKISSKNKKGTALGKGLGLAPPRSAPFLTPQKKSANEESAAAPKTGFSLAPPPKHESQSLSFALTFPGIDETKSKLGDQSEIPKKEKPLQQNVSLSFESTFDDEEEAAGITANAIGEEAAEAPASLWDSVLPLSKQIRPSAAAALIRGPPATRHFGGNRGGLPDFLGLDRLGVGGVVISGPERTIVWRDDEDPPALTYPVGASGALVSDQMNDEGSEFLCCFRAKEKRVVLYELNSKAIVVELQMTTKLNFWRFLPPEADRNTLCFILVTPVGGFHWMPLEESPSPQQVWKRGPGLQAKKVVSYEEGGTDGRVEIRSRIGLILATEPKGAGFLEAWLVSIYTSSRPTLVSDNVMGACLCQPPNINDEEPFLPLFVTVDGVADAQAFVKVYSLNEGENGELALIQAETSYAIDMTDYEDIDLTPPAQAMGTFPEAICVSLSNILVVLFRRKGLVVAFELEEDGLGLIAEETVDHYVVDAVMRYSPQVGGAEIVMLLSDHNHRDGRIVSFCFRAAA